MADDYLLVSFCNQLWTPELSLAVIDIQSGECSWVDLPTEVQAPGVSGVSGIAQVPGGFIVALQHPEQGVLVRLDDDLAPVGTFSVNGAKDLHALHYREGDRTLFVTSTGSDQLLACRLDEHAASIVEQEVFWTAAGSPGTQDDVHLNSVAELDGSLVVSMFGLRDPESWTHTRGGVVIDIESGEYLARDLHHPHSATVHGATLLVAESGAGVVHQLVPHRTPLIDLPGQGYLRGLAISENHVFVGVSAPRLKSRSRGALNAADNVSFSAGRSRLVQIDRQTGEVLRQVDCSALGQEIFDVVLLPIARRELSREEAFSRRAWSLERRAELQHGVIALLQEQIAQRDHAHNEALAHARLDYEALAKRRSVRIAMRLASLVKSAFALRARLRPGRS